MNAIPNQKQIEAPPAVVSAKVIARALSCTPRYIHLLAEAGTIPHYRWGKALIRFDQGAVFKALGIQTEAAAGQSK
jgi:hypothetical protein